MPVRHGRHEWLRYSAYGCSGPALNRSAILDIVIHYTGGNTSINSDEDMARLLARINDQYMRDPNRGYSIGYNFGCAYHNGDLWDARGEDLRCAANGCQLVNVPAVAILVPTPNVSAQPSPAQDASLKNIWIPMLKRVFPNAHVHVLGHRDVRTKCNDGGATACPGEPIYSRIKVNYYDTPSVTPPPITPGDDDMKWLLRCSDGTPTQKAQTFAWDGQTLTLINPATVGVGDYIGLYGNSGQILTNFNAATIQAMINTQYNGPIGVTIPGFTMPPVPAWASQASVNNGFAAGAKTTHLQEVEDKVDQVLAKPGGPGGGVTVDEIETILNNSTVQIEHVPGNATIVVNET